MLKTAVFPAYLVISQDFIGDMNRESGFHYDFLWLCTSLSHRHSDLSFLKECSLKGLR